MKIECYVTVEQKVAGEVAFGVLQFWSPCYMKNVVKLERVLKFTRILPGFEGLSFCVKLGWSRLYFLKRRRLRDDPIERYNIMRVID